MDGCPSLTTLLKGCAKRKDLRKGIRVHAEIQSKGFIDKNTYIASALVSMYAKCGALNRAREALDQLPVRDLVCWSAIIAGYAQQGQCNEALDCLQFMQWEGLTPNEVTYVSILKACTSVGAADKGKIIHDHIVRQHLLGKSVELGNALVDMYAKCGALSNAQQVLNMLPLQDVVSWNALIAGFAQQGYGEKALDCFKQMHHKGLSPDVITFTCILKACSSIGDLDTGMQIHEEIFQQNLMAENLVLGNSLLDMYAKCGALTEAQQVFDDLSVRNTVSWNALIAGYSTHEQDNRALNCLNHMRCEGLVPDTVTFACVLKVCSSVKAFDKGKDIHDELVSCSLLGKNIVLDTAVIEMYAKCGALAKAQKVLEQSSVRDVVMWSTLIAAYVEQEQGEEALSCLAQMERERFSPTKVTFICILKACGSIGATEKGSLVHDELVRQGLLGTDLVLDTALVDMYAKCGAMLNSQKLLEELPVRDTPSWNALIAGYAQQLQSKETLNCFEQMLQEGLFPDAVTLTCMLNTCSRVGLTEKALIYSLNISRRYHITQSMEHCTCIIDLFGRMGHFDEALSMVKKMPRSDDFGVWSALLNACWKWGNVKIGEWAFERARKVYGYGSAAYVYMANIYLAAGMQKDADDIVAMRWKNFSTCNDIRDNHSFSDCCAWG